MQSEPERLDDDEVYERDREAWNLPRPRASLAIPSVPKAQSEDSGDMSRSLGEAERTT